MIFQNPNGTDNYSTVVTTSTLQATSSWEIIDDDNPYNQIWKWKGENNGVDTFHVQVYIDDYADVEVGMNDGISFGIQDGGILVSGTPIYTEIVTSSFVSGTYLDCNNPVSYTLNNLAQGGSSTWIIKQSGYTKASGSGTSASANNLNNGSAYAKFTVSFPCGLNSLTFQKDFWFGIPSQPSTNPSGYPTVQMTLNQIMPISASSGGASSYVWSATGSITKLSSHSNVMTVEATSLGNGNFYCNGVNNCGTSSTGGGSVYVSYGGGQLGPFIVYPNPSKDYIHLEIDETQTKVASDILDLLLKEFKTLRIIDKHGEIKLVEKYNGEKYKKMDISNLDQGVYSIQLISENEIFSTTVVIN